MFPTAICVLKIRTGKTFPYCFNFLCTSLVNSLMQGIRKQSLKLKHCQALDSRENPRKYPEKNYMPLIYFYNMLKSKTWFLGKSVSCQPAVYFYSVECFGKWLSKCLSFVDLRTFSWGQNQNLMNRPRFKHMLVYSLNMNQHQILLLGSINNRWYCAARQQSQNIWTLHPSHHQWWGAVSISTSDLGGPVIFIPFLGLNLISLWGGKNKVDFFFFF